MTDQELLERIDKIYAIIDASDGVDGDAQALAQLQDLSRSDLTRIVGLLSERITPPSQVDTSETLDLSEGFKYYERCMPAFETSEAFDLSEGFKYYQQCMLAPEKLHMDITCD